LHRGTLSYAAAMTAAAVARIEHGGR
jgi:hypothetical protein